MFEDEVWNTGMLVNPNTIELEYEDEGEDIESKTIRKRKQRRRVDI